MIKHTIIIGDSNDMQEIKSEKIHFVITSPPYWNLKKYGSKGIGQNEAYSKYLVDIKNVLSEVKRVLAPGRFAVINVGTAVSNEGMKPINGDIVKMMSDLGFNFKKEIIWMKPKGTQGLWQRGTTKFLKREPFPGYFNLNIMHEYVLVFQNDGEWEIPHEKKFQLTEEFIKEVAWSVWPMRVSRLKGHPAPFPIELPERLIKLYTVENETVLDPFAGIGTTMKAAKNLGRDSIIYEINSEYLEAIKSTVDWDEKSKEYEIKIREITK
jgi:site-specific DNA-methyltransferase (adenine-specific)